MVAVDMYGTVGSLRRRRIILAEFVVGVWLLGMAVNYVPLALHAMSLSRPGVLDAELGGVDVRAELRYYGAAQLWLIVPLLVALLALVQWRYSRGHASHRV